MTMHEGRAERGQGASGPQDEESLRAWVTVLARAVAGLTAEVAELRDGPRRPRLYGYADAGAELRTGVRWLQNNIRGLPHVKAGRTVLFTDEDLDRIIEILHIEPTESPP